MCEWAKKYLIDIYEWAKIFSIKPINFIIDPWNTWMIMFMSRGDIALYSIMLIIIFIVLAIKYGKKYKYLIIIAIFLYFGPKSILYIIFASLFIPTSIKYKVPIGCDKYGMCV